MIGLGKVRGAYVASFVLGGAGLRGLAFPTQTDVVRVGSFLYLGGYAFARGRVFPTEKNYVSVVEKSKSCFCVDCGFACLKVYRGRAGGVGYK